MIGHEITHVQQYARFGRFGTLDFLELYGSEFLQGFVRSGDVDLAYRNIPFEKEAFAKKRELRTDLRAQFGEKPCEGTGSLEEETCMP